MHKKITIILVCLLLLLTACAKLVEEEKEDEPKIYEHTLDTSNFESFYDVSFDLEQKNQGAYNVLLDVKPKTGFTVTSLRVHFKLTITEKFQTTNIEEVFEFETTSIVHIEELFEVESNALRKSAYISSFELSVQSGLIKTTQVIQITSKTYPVLFDEPDNSTIVIEDKVANETNYNEFMNLIGTLNNKDSNHVTIQMTQTTQVTAGLQTYYDQTSTITSIQKQPFYIAVDNGFSNVVIHPLDDSVDYVLFAVYEDMKVNDNLLIQPIVINESYMKDVLDSVGQIEEPDLINEYYYNPNKMLFTKRTDGYTVKSHIKDFMPEDAYDELVYMYTELGLNTDVLENTIVTMRVSVNGSVYTVTIDMIFEFEEPVKQTVRSTISVNIDYSSFDPLTMYDESFIILPSESIEGIVIQTNPLIPTFVPKSPENDYFKVYLEAGQYVMYMDRENVYIDILDVYGYDADLFITYQEAGTWRFQNSFFIKESGYYYFKANTNYYVQDYTFFVEKLEDTAQVVVPTPLMLGDNDIEIKGLYDLAYFTFDAPEDMVLEISGDSTTLYYFQEKTEFRDYYQNYRVFEFDSNKSWLFLEAGINYFYFNQEEIGTTTIHVKPYGTLHHKSSDIETMSVITDEFLENPMLLGYEAGASYLRLDASHAVYKFTFESSTNILHPIIRIYNALTHDFVTYVYTDVENNYILNEGVYYLAISGGNTYEFNIKVDETLFENQIIEEALGSVEDMYVDMATIPFVSGTLINNEHEPRHRFTIDSPQTIVVGIGQFGHLLYDEDGRLMTFNHINYQFTRTLYFLLPGTYDIVPFMKGINSTFVDYKLNIAILEQAVEQDTYHLKEPAIYDEAVQVMNFVTDNSYDYEVIKITVAVDSVYYISANKSIYIYDIDLKQVNTTSADSGRNVELKAGTYYLVSSISPIGHLRISIFLQTD